MEPGVLAGDRGSCHRLFCQICVHRLTVLVITLRKQTLFSRDADFFKAGGKLFYLVSQVF